MALSMVWFVVIVPAAKCSPTRAATRHPAGIRPVSARQSVMRPRLSTEQPVRHRPTGFLIARGGVGVITQLPLLAVHSKRPSCHFAGHFTGADGWC